MNAPAAADAGAGASAAAATVAADGVVEMPFQSEID